MNKLKTLLELKFGSVPEGISVLGGAPVARQVFKDFQYHLYNGQPKIKEKRALFVSK